jgi:hypothetical protein
MKKSIEEKFNTVIQKNTFYFFNKKGEEKYEGYINLLKETLLIIKNRIETTGLKKEIFEELISEKEYGLKALLALTGFSNEYLKRLTTIIRIVSDPELSRLTCKEKWYKETNPENIQEWSDKTIQNMINKDPYFRKGIVNIFFEGASIPFLINTIPLFELKKLSISKIKFEIPEMIDTLIRYKEKGSYSGQKWNNPETVIEEILERNEITHDSGDLSELIDNAPDSKRTMDFIIPNKDNPKIIIESSFLVTTSSGQGDKSKTEISIDTLIKQHYPKAIFIGFVDGIGWYVRKGDLKRMITAYEDVFTFHKDELNRFEKLLTEIL